LVAAIYLARQGVSVRIFEAGSTTGGLASGFTIDGFSFDYGPYILLDRPGLEWAFQQLGEVLANHVELRKIEDIYEVNFPNGALVSFHSDLEHTASNFENCWPGSARKYIAFVHDTSRSYQRLSQLLHVSRPGLADLLASQAWKEAWFLVSSLQQVLARTGLPKEIVDAIGIWTHVAGQEMSHAPSPMAFVPALFQTVGSYYPQGGIRRIAEVLTQIAMNSGVQFELNRRIKKIHTQGKVRVLTTQVPAEWNSRFNLYRSSMNPVMTAKFMRAGRMPHRSPYFKGLYFAGSSTHPGQWISFCAMSGVLAAKSVLEDASC
jgi:phytoene dehydrogenase-like protein